VDPPAAGASADDSLNTLHDDSVDTAALYADVAAVATGARRPGEPSPSETAAGEVLARVVLPAAQRLRHGPELARGGMGAIEQAHDRSLLRHVARKVLHRELVGEGAAVRSFVREAQITGQLDHPNIVPVHELGLGDDGRPYFTMKLVEGQTFGELIHELPPGPPPHERLVELLEVVDRVADALAFAHSRGVVHRDVKPQNVMVGAFGQIYLMDWGVAALATATEVPAHAEAATLERGHMVASSAGDELRGATVGTPAFMSPEQARGEPVDARADVFALGGLVYAMLCRQPPRRAATAFAALELARQGTPTPAPLELLGSGAVPVELDRIVRRAMHPDPAQRYDSALAFQRDLRRFLRGGGEFPRVVVPAGAWIVRQGEPGSAAYIIVRGTCEVLREVEGQLQVVRTMGAGQVFGETAILAATTRTASVRARDEVVLYEVNAEVLDREVDAMKPWMGAFIRTLAQRFREREAAGASEPGPASAGPGGASLLRGAQLHARLWAVAQVDPAGLGTARTLEWRDLVPALGGNAGALLVALTELPGVVVAGSTVVLSGPPTGE
jgi:serine/threonine-protein kinase